MILRTGFALRKSCRERRALSQRDFPSSSRTANAVTCPAAFATPVNWALGREEFCCAAEHPALSSYFVIAITDFLKCSMGDVFLYTVTTEVCYGISSETLLHNH